MCWGWRHDVVVVGGAHGACGMFGGWAFLWPAGTTGPSWVAYQWRITNRLECIIFGSLHLVRKGRLGGLPRHALAWCAVG